LVKNGKFKIPMTDNGARTTSTKLTDTDHGHATRTLSEGTREFPDQKVYSHVQSIGYKKSMWKNQETQVFSRQREIFGKIAVL
jgi:hypothetical protein